MGTLTAYSMSVAIILVLEYIVYKSLLANATFYRFNRVVLLSCYAIALLAIPAADFVTGLFQSSATAVTGGVTLGAVSAVALDAPEGNETCIWHAIPLIYIAGMATVAALTVYSYARMFRIIRRGEKREIDGATIVIAETTVSPFSWGRYLVVSPADADNRLIIEHELSHIRNRHSIDLIFAQMFIIFNWFNPVAYLMRRELSAVHEYDVDRRILSSGIKASDYQMLLIRKTVGPGFQSIANSLNHSQLKNRLTMMMKSKSSRVRHLCAAALLPAAMLAVAMTDFPAVASTIKNVAAVSYDKVSENYTPSQEDVALPSRSAVNEAADKKSEPRKAVETMPQYPGGERAMLQALMDELKYPENLAENDIKGKVIVSFTVTKEGSIDNIKIVRSAGNEALDAEAVRAVKEGLKVKWTPGTVGGEAVDCHYTLPVMFSTKKEASNETAAKKSEPRKAVETLPQYPGGEAAMLQALMDELKYPENMAENDIKGNVIVTFTVTKEGTIDDIKILRSAGNEALDAEAVRALKDGLTEKWTPGTVGGEAVDCRYTLPVMFKTKK